jgi:hypothetical protein
VNHPIPTVRSGLVITFLLASLASAALAASPAAGQDLERPADPALAPPLSIDPPASSEFWQRQRALAEAPVAEEERGGRHPAPALPTFTGVATVGRTRYSYTMVGTNPELRGAKNVVVPVLIIPVRLEFGDGTVLDPSQPNSCLGGLVPLTLALQSPLFQNFDYGEGPKQFLEQIRRMEYWNFTAPGKLNPSYSVRLSPSVLPVQTISLSASNTTQQAACVTTGGVQKLGHVDIEAWVDLLLSQVVPQFPKLGVNASTFVLFLVHNVIFTENGSPIAVSYHSILPSQNGTVTYAVSEVGNVQRSKLVDLSALSHEFAEWLDDPFINNATPPWGNVGQVSGCQANLEVGDPLTGTFLPAVQMPNGYSYQPQETAFFPWFFDQVPSIGFDGWYSTGGTFRSPAKPCH